MEKVLRKDIQGLRAYAVLAVLFFHLGTPPLRGGFLGVDLFFVVSGFVITQRIFIEIEQTGGFNTSKFFKRRWYRLVPALLLTSQLTIIASWLFLSPIAVQELVRKTAIAGSFFLPNLYIARGQTDYFGISADLNPLLHLWSIGVEYQFYGFMAFAVSIILVVSKEGRFLRNFTVVMVALLMSGLAALLMNTWDPQQLTYFWGYYSPLPRSFELCAGALSAVALKYGVVIPSKLHSSFQYLGIFAVALCFVFIPGDNLPSIELVFLVFGVCLILLSGDSKSRLGYLVFNSKTLQIIGESSYSIYLIHLPILVILKYYFPSNSIILGLGGLCSVLVGIIVAKFVENPFIRPRGNFVRAKKLLLISVLFSLVFNLTVASSITRMISSSWQTNYGALNKGDIGQKPFFDYLKSNFTECDIPELQNLFLDSEGVTRCFKSKPSGTIDLAIIGDSHAESLFIGLAQGLPKLNVIYLITAPSPHVSSGAKMKQIYDWLSVHTEVQKVVLNGFWQQKGLSESDLVQDLKALEAPNRNIILTTDTPDFPFDASTCKFRLSVTIGSAICSNEDQKRKIEYQKHLSLINQVANDFPNVEIVDTFRHFCTEEICSMKEGEHLLFRDTDHLNILGSQYIGRYIVMNSSLKSYLNF